MCGLRGNQRQRLTSSRSSRTPNVPPTTANLLAELGAASHACISGFQVIAVESLVSMSSCQQDAGALWSLSICSGDHWLVG